MFLIFVYFSSLYKFVPANFCNQRKFSFFSVQCKNVFLVLGVPKGQTQNPQNLTPITRDWTEQDLLRILSCAIALHYPVLFWVLLSWNTARDAPQQMPSIYSRTLLKPWGSEYFPICELRRIPKIKKINPNNLKESFAFLL